MMNSQFSFKNMEVTEEIRIAGNLALLRISDYLSHHFTLMAMIEKKEQDYQCAFDVYLSHGPLVARATRKHPEEAIRAAETKIMQHLKKFTQIPRSPQKIVVRETLFYS